MRLYIDDITDEYGGEGVSVYSIVRGMEFFYAEVRASGITLLENLGGDEMKSEHEAYAEIMEAFTGGLE